MGEVWLTNKEWQVITYVNLQNLITSYELILDDVKQIDTMCSRNENRDWYKLTDCTTHSIRKTQELKMVQSLMELVSDQYDLPLLIQRSKRSVLTFVGELSKMDVVRQSDRKTP
jgi:hypothetical protein